MTTDTANYCYTADGWETIEYSSETEGRVTVRTAIREITIEGASWAMREYPHTNYQLKLDIINKLAWVRVPPKTRAENHDDVGHPFRIVE